jgi:starch synthase
VKIHILKAIINYLNNEELLSYIQIFNQMEQDLLKLYEKSKIEKLDLIKYEQMANIFINGEMQYKWNEYLNHCRKILGIFQNVSDLKSIKILEKLFIQLLGHIDRQIRNYSVRMLNMIYDGTTWQDKSAFPHQNTNIKLLDDKLILELNIRKTEYSKNSIILIVSSPSENKDINYQCISFLKCKNEVVLKDRIKLIFPIGNLNKCGYYDWYLVRFSKGRFVNIKIMYNNEIIDGKGRTIVLNKDIQNLSAHEVFPDLIKAEIDKNQGRITKRGNFKTLESKLEEYNKRFINCLYIMGALERDNNIIYDEATGDPIDIGNDDACPMAVTSRNSISS